ncbi:MAG: DUF3467 domain-containing protein [Candidatus Cloacimonetes bacterium]|nr:DUF3467 domain-containing protein [Candidatus Cloacimonadota bacterium]
MPRIYTRVVMTPSHAKQLLQLLEKKRGEL